MTWVLCRGDWKLEGSLGTYFSSNSEKVLNRNGSLFLILSSILERPEFFLGSKDKLSILYFITLYHLHHLLVLAQNKMNSAESTYLGADQRHPAPADVLPYKLICLLILVPMIGTLVLNSGLFVSKSSRRGSIYNAATTLVGYQR